MNRSAWVAGATGLVGSELLKILTGAEIYKSINILTRRELKSDQQSVISHVVDFNDINSFPKDTQVNDVFICLGTTMNKAGSKEAFLAVDFEYVLRVAEWAKASGAETCSVISSVGADQNTSNFYLRTKGEMEEALKGIGFNHLLILRPSLLLGNRNEFRLAEKLGTFLAILFSPLMIGKLKNYKAVKAEKVARAMFVGSINNKQAIIIMENREILNVN